jgi:tetratricopeptide (TPR) repeat protein
MKTMKALRNSCGIAILIVALSGTSEAQATQSQEIQVTGSYTQSGSDTPDTAKLLAALDARHKALSEAGKYLRTVDAIRRLGLSDERLDAYVMGIIDPQPQSPRTVANGARTDYLSDARVAIDTAKVARAMDALRIDPESSIDLMELWKQAGEVWSPLAEKNRQTLQVDLLLAQATFALSKQEEGPKSARIASEENRKRARGLVDQAKLLDPDSTAVHFKLGDVLLAEGQAADAEKEFRMALARDASSSFGHDKLGNALLQEGKPGDAAAEFREAIRIDANSFVAHSDLGITMRSQGNLDDALTEFREAVRLNPDFVDGHNNLAISLANQRRIPAAIVEFREIIRISPGSALGHYNAAIALADMEEDKECIVELRETIRINPNHYNAHYNLGEMLRLQGELKESAHEFSEYVRLVPVSPATQKGIDRAKSFIEAFADQ